MVVLWFKKGNDDPVRNSIDEYCTQLVEIKDFNALIDDEPFFDQPVTRNLWKACQNVKKQWLYNRKFIRLFVSSKLWKIKHKRQRNTSTPQKINFTAKLEEDEVRQ